MLYLISHKHILLFALLFFSFGNFISQYTISNSTSSAQFASDGHLEYINNNGNIISFDSSDIFVLILFDITAQRPVSEAHNNFHMLTVDSLYQLTVNQVVLNSDTIHQEFDGFIDASLTDSFHVEINWWLDNNGGISGNMGSQIWSNTMSLWSFIFPYVNANPIDSNVSNDALILPLYSGVKVPNPINRDDWPGTRINLNYPYEWLDTLEGESVNGQYPASYFMQFAYYYDEDSENGIYVQTNDTTGRLKDFIIYGDSVKKHLKIGVNHFREDCETPLNIFWVSPEVISIKPFNGDWIDACKSYREWTAEQFWCSNKQMYYRQRPSDSINFTITLYADSMFNSAYSDTLNLINMIGSLDTLRNRLGDNLNPMVHLRSWNWPLPYWDSTKLQFWSIFQDSCLKRNLRLIPYMTSRHWGHDPAEPDDLLHTRDSSKAVNLDGDPYDASAFSGVSHYVMNPVDPMWRNKMYSYVEDLFSLYTGVATDLYFDVVPNMKMDWNPRHPRGGGNDYMQAYRLLGDSCSIVAKNYNPDAISIFEGRVEYHLENCDGCINPNFGGSSYFMERNIVPIPIFSCVFSDYVYTSNSPSDWLTDMDTNILNYNFLSAYSFINGDIMGYKLRPNWINNSPNHFELQAMGLLKNMINVRTNIIKWITYGEWMRPPSIIVDSINVHFETGDIDIKKPTVLSGAYTINHNQESVFIFVNYTDQAQAFTATFDLQEYTSISTPLNRYIATDHNFVFDQVMNNSTINESITLQPHSSIAWVFSDTLLAYKDDISSNNLIVNIYPNPANDNVIIEIKANENGVVNLQLIDFSGRILDDKMYLCKEGITNINYSIRELPSGVYYVNIYQGKKIESKKLLVY